MVRLDTEFRSCPRPRALGDDMARGSSSQYRSHRRMQPRQQRTRRHLGLVEEEVDALSQENRCWPGAAPDSYPSSQVDASELTCLARKSGKTL